MKLVLLRVSACCVISILLQRSLFAGQVSIEWTTIGNPGNAADPLTGFGSMDSAYNIGTYDVTVSQYVPFLNSNDPTGADPLQLWVGDMGYEIKYNASASNGSKYSVNAGWDNYPIDYVTWYSAARYANWMQNGQAPGATETGAYTLLGGTPTPSNANSIGRNPGATVFLPSENQWYKAAYYDPATSSYFLFPTSSNSAPTPTTPTAQANSSNYDSALGEENQTEVSAVGAYSGTTSPYGLFDMGGDLLNWNEAVFQMENLDDQLVTVRGIRGDWYYGDAAEMESTVRAIPA